MALAIVPSRAAYCEVVKLSYPLEIAYDTIWTVAVAFATA